MKSDNSIKSISISAIERHSIDVSKWTRTTISPPCFPDQLIQLPNELTIASFKADENNWTFLSTQRIMGAIDAVFRETKFNELDDVFWGIFKNTDRDSTLFTTIDIYGEKNDFLMETGNPSMAIIYAIDTISVFYRASS